MSNQAVDVKILGKLTRVNCPSGEEESLQNAAKDLDNRLSELAERTKVTNEVQLLTFAALNICYELHNKNREDDSQQTKLTEKIELLSASLDDALKKVKLEKS
ncbi:cell division protein ZapA [Vibrio sp. ZSDE26]|uniref:Cell division protein ZapA n=1 Tax=Vibrio amylolyticus TaxID=2847292 RepID=A0A9X1XSJ6_9VIBR|nr:cell division protein ZapA [Vibrio amylolyticus]MCK6264744.1 cell division protein ZapA [Vibrio amylolyticus]